MGVGLANLTILNRDEGKIDAALGIAVCLMTSTFCYTRIFFKLRYQRTQVHSSPPQQENKKIPLNILRYRKTVSTSLCLQMSLVFCYLPYLLLAPFAYNHIEEKHSSALYTQYYSTATLVFSDSALNPILYCWRFISIPKMKWLFYPKKIFLFYSNYTKTWYDIIYNNSTL